ncbi:hypothetical protein [Nocardia sp. NPDC058705]|uniref:hypothetical protein n=1 Tax=Nocardia sp. NPDC058705 TaxID=3346609 RepID=UPI0036782DB0
MTPTDAAAASLTDAGALTDADADADEPDSRLIVRATVIERAQAGADVSSPQHGPAR